MTNIEPGDKFGDWTVIKEAEKKYYYTCRCKCGKVQDVYKSSLKNGKSKGCMSCAVNKIRKSKRKNFDKDFIGKKFGRLTIVKSLGYKGRAMYLCKCDCGNQVEVSRSGLLSGKATSCGCAKTENSKKLMDQIKNKGYKKLREGYDNGTNVFSLNQKVSKNNTTGVKGVSFYKKNKYRAYIGFNHKQIHLGVFDTLEDAKRARKEAEKKYFEPIIEEHKNK